MQLWKASARGGEAERLTDGEAWSPVWSRDGKYIYFTWREDLGDSWVMDVK